ncbi:fatty acid desaturase [Dietzia sp. B32]|uniref:fatty acid desaturase n=1 Tax=Dietzia sp. B32 TaxID=2915130 RepID=UPI0022030606|nr:fatty acid desaturase [Dietzia sp. B32]UVE94067.1 fatty acid desaturase [Dietzia sp. B32]
MSSTEYIRPAEGAPHAHDDHAHRDHTHHGHAHHGHDHENVEPFAWTDAKRYLWLLGLIPAMGLFLSMPIVAGFNALGWGVAATVAWFLLPFLVYVAIPLGDLAIGADGENPPDEVMDRLEADPFYRWCTYLYIPFQYASLITAAYLWSADDLSWLGYDGGLGIAASIGVAWTVAITGGIGINTAHELGHKIAGSEKWLSKVALATTGYGHFFIEHNRGHHARVATPEDPASSRFGEPFWAFLPRSVFGSLKSAWHLESERLGRLGKSPWSIRNDNLNAWLMTVVLFGGLIAVFGWEIAPWLIIQAVFGFSLLEVVNYLEHYGLLRQKTSAGRYQRCRPEHSWNSDHLVTNIFLYHLQRHSDHHANPMRRYQVLRSFEQAPQLPSGYATMMVLAYVPPLWRKVMDKRVLAHYDGDITRANIQPSKREKILARYGAGSTAVVEQVVADTDIATDQTSPTGEYVCPNCGNHYSEAAGLPREGFPAGTPWSAIPDTWRCSDCGVRDKVDFLPVK